MVALQLGLFGLMWMFASFTLNRHRRAFVELSLFNCANALGLTLIGLRGRLPSSVTDTVADIAIYAGFIALVCGAARLLYQEIDVRDLALKFLLISVLVLFFGEVYPHPTLRVLSLTAGIVWLCVAGTWSASTVVSSKGHMGLGKLFTILGSFVVLTIVGQMMFALFTKTSLGFQSVAPSSLALAYLLSMGLFAANAIFAFMVVTELISELQQLSRCDALTGLPNRLALKEKMEVAWQEFQEEQTSLVVVSIDVDSFKQINDDYGHATGDEVLTKVAAVMNEKMRKDDILARTGGEEFVALLPDTNISQARHVVERLRAAVSSAPNLHPNPSENVSVSVGVAMVHALLDQELEGTLARADAAMYEAKQRGRDRVVVAASPLV